MSIGVSLSNHPSPAPSASARLDPAARLEAALARRHPVSRWYICPLASWLAARIAGWPIRPWHLTLTGLACGILAAIGIASQAVPPAIAAALVLAAWFFDRADGILARRLGAGDRCGAWLDANTDEIIDVGLQVSVATAAAHASGSVWPWTWLVLFLLGKYLLMHGLCSQRDDATATSSTSAEAPHPLLRRLYHLPGNADVRVHLLAVALLTGWLTAQMAIVALYYNLRWIVRYLTGLKQAAETSA